MENRGKGLAPGGAQGPGLVKVTSKTCRLGLVLCLVGVSMSEREKREREQRQRKRGTQRDKETDRYRERQKRRGPSDGWRRAASLANEL